MKILSFAIAFIVAAGISNADEGREVASKTLELKFETVADARKWSLRELGFKEWIKAVSIPGWTELHKSESADFYFAIYRKGDYLMLCENDRKDAYRYASTSVRAVNDKIAGEVWEKPSLWTTLKWNVSHSQGGYGGQENFTTWKIIKGFSGDIIVEYQVPNEGSPYREVLRQPVTWKNQAEHDGGGQPATRPESK